MTASRLNVTSAALLLVLLVASPGWAQQIPLTDKITRLEGTWVRAADRGWGGICGVSASNGLRLRVSATEVAIDANTFNRGVASQTLVPKGVVKLDGSETVLTDGRTATATTDAGWLAVTMKQPRNGGYVNVMREVYILDRNGDELTVWRTLNVTTPDGSQGKIDCGNHHAIVYTRK